MTLQESAISVAVAVIILDFLSGGWATTQVTNQLMGPFGSTLLDSAQCSFAVMYMKPTANLGGLEVPIPSGDDVALAIAIFSVIYSLIYKPKKWQHGVYMLVLIWVLIRLLASYFANHVAGCIGFVEAASEVTSMFYWVSIITIPLLIIQFWRKRE